MLKFSCWLFISVLLSVMVNFVSVEARPQRTSSQGGLNGSTITVIKPLPPSVSRNENNKTKTRILFRGDLSDDFTDQDIIFPDTYHLIFGDIPKITSTPQCSNGVTFCEDIDSYPYQQVKEILQRKHIATHMFGQDELPDDIYSISNRNGDYESYVCASLQKTVFPRIGKNKNNKWKFIVNQEEDDGYLQGVRIEVCRKEGVPCDLIGERASGFITSCKQKYMLRRMLSVSESGDVVPDTFQLPSACCCSYKKDLSFLSRYGVDDVAGRVKIRNKS